MTSLEPVSSIKRSRKLIAKHMTNLKRVLGYMSTVHGSQRDVKRAWAELFEMERKLVRQQFLLRLYGVLLVGFLFGLFLDKVGF